ncbi:thiamine biosynthesis protein ThiC [Erythrobacter sp. SCSIO 43205]|uniref:thiamine biosynthesis protein ThiC n=1 Tax=Erythrobacter sp. SCSIO 43205 TaxID=2779361 RepID=UPI001CA90FBA|nr:thiamine biosynthesis protein ThiC [Erythrobacter sp. SCSIO 43205]UAB77787.1 thiamine biosynthesis protein ThiC [Erythrobacter sp. SCSIO 43205]
MEFTFNRNVKLTAVLLLLAAVTQALYTALYVAEVDVPRQLIWGFEAALFVMTALFAGTATVQTTRLHIGFVAIAFASVLNIIQVGIGLTQFGPFREAAGALEGMEPAAASVVAYSFMVYNAAKAMLAFAAIIFGMAKLSEGAKALGGLTVFMGAVAFVTNILSMAMGRDWSGELPLAGGLGVLATVLLAVCLLGSKREGK